MARPSARVTLPQQNHSGPRIPALHPAAPPDSSFSTPLGVNRSAGARIADSATGNTNNEFTGKYEDFMRLMKAANHEVMYREVSSTHAGSEVAVGGGQGEKQNLGFLRLPIKRRHSEAEQTQSFPPPSLCQPRTPTLPQVITELENATSSPSPVTAHSFEEMQALQSLQVMGSSRPQSIVCQPIPSIEQVVPTSITVATTTAPETATNSIPNTKKNARDRLFDALVAANLRVSGWTVDARGIPVPPVDNILWRRTISGPDDLERAESVRLFEILEACSHATQPDAPMTMTRGNIDRFFDAIFKNWDPESWDAEAARTIRPDFAASAETIAGKVCAHPSLHHDIVSCMAMPACDSDVIAKVTYVYTPHSVKLEFFAKSTAESTANEGSDANPNVDSTLMGSALATRGRRRQEQAQTSPRLAPLNPTDREDIRWITATDWTAGVRDDLQRTIIARLHKYNKHQAIWQARRFIQGWARGALPEGSIFENGNGNSANGSSSGGTSNRRASMGVDGEGLGFLTADGAKMSLKILVNMR